MRRAPKVPRMRDMTLRSHPSDIMSSRRDVAGVWDFDDTTRPLPVDSFGLKLSSSGLASTETVPFQELPCSALRTVACHRKRDEAPGG